MVSLNRDYEFKKIRKWIKMKDIEIKEKVRQGYGKIARESSSCCPTTSCCSPLLKAEEISRDIGYGQEDISSVPEGSNLGLGCGNPIATASVKKGETIIDLGSGAGFDSFLAANATGKDGKVIGIDMTPDMVAKARKNAEKSGYKNVEFILAEIEHVPLEDNIADLIISNCVINLAPDKKKVFSEAYRLLKPGGRMMVSDIVLKKDLPANILDSVEAYIGCISGAEKVKDYLDYINNAGFREVEILDESVFSLDNINKNESFKEIMKTCNISEKDIGDTQKSIISIKVSAIK
jgi:ubiquinone/menaquinone biosynthesis C-methylase UbiE